PVRLRTGECGAQFLVKQPAVGEAGEIVVCGQMMEALFHALAFRNVAGDGGVILHHTLSILVGDDHLGDRYDPSVPAQEFRLGTPYADPGCRGEPLIEYETARPFRMGLSDLDV